jgi:hypothetical protein
MNMPDMPDMDARGPFCIDPAAAVWTLVRELIEQQQLIAQLDRMLAALQAEHLNSPDEVIRLNYGLKNVSDLVALKLHWYSKTLPSIVAKFAVALEAHETFGDSAVTIDDPIDAGAWRSKYFVAVDDLTVTSPPNKGR